MAAVAVAGFLVYMGISSGKKKKSKDGNKKAVSATSVEEQKKETEPEQELENYFFIDPEKTPQEANEIIMKWMND